MDKQSRNEADQKALEEILGSYIHSNDSQNVKPADYCLPIVIISQNIYIYIYLIYHLMMYRVLKVMLKKVLCHKKLAW